MDFKIQRQKLSFVGWFSIGNFKANCDVVYTSLKRVVCRRGRAVYLLSSVKWYLYSLSVWLSVVSWTHLARWASMYVLSVVLVTRWTLERYSPAVQWLTELFGQWAALCLAQLSTLSSFPGLRPSVRRALQSRHCCTPQAISDGLGRALLRRAGRAIHLRLVGRWAHVDGS